MALLEILAVAIGLVAWPLVSYTFSNLLSQTPFGIQPHGALNNGNVITPPLSTFIEQTLALENITGLSVSVVQQHGDPEFHSWGYRTEDGDEVSADTLFHMASVSKAFCAAALGLLIDDFANGNNVTALPPGVSELTWRTPLKDLLPEWQLMDAWASERANLRDILSHVSGLPRHDAAYGRSDTPQAMVARLRHLRPAFELRERWSYNNIMYMVAADVIATYSGQPYAAFVEERLFAPLGMSSSTFSPTKAEASGKFTQSWAEEGRRIPECLTEDLVSLMAGPGGIISSAVDMAKWVSTWINGGVYDNQTLIPLSVYTNASYSYAIATDHPTQLEPSIVGYGMGWFRASYRGHDVVYHSGALPGLSTLVAFLPDDGIGVTLFANGGNKATPVLLLASRIVDSALGLVSPPAPTSSPSGNFTTTERPPRAENSTSSLESLAGTYTNPGYGSFTLCAPFSVSAYCAHVRSNFTAVIDGVHGDSDPSENLLAEWPRVWSSHVRMRPKQGHVFNIDFTSLYPNGYGKDTTPFETSEITTEALAEFVVEDGQVVGFGLGGLIGELTERARKCETVRDRAEVWFDKV